MGLSAREVMTARLVTVDPDESLADLESLLVSRRVGGVPVVEDGRLVGIISRSDVVRVLCTEQSLADSQLDFYREFGADLHPPSEVAARQMLEEREEAARLVANRLSQLKVRDAMIPSVLTVEVDAPLAEVARQLVERRIHRIVVTEGERPVGIVSSLDLVRLIAEQRLS